MSKYEMPDDTKEEYYEAWKESSPGLVPKSFDIKEVTNHMPDLKTWAWDVLFNIIGNFDDKYVEYIASDLESMVNYDGEHLWVIDNNGCGDFMKISDYQTSERWCIVFNHESERSPYGDTKMPSGLDWIMPYKLENFFAKSEAITEIYRYKNDFNNNSKWYTSTEIANLEDYWYNHSFEKAEDVANRDQYLRLYNNILNDVYPTLNELHSLIKDDLITALTFRNIHQIKLWYKDEKEKVDLFKGLLNDK